MARRRVVVWAGLAVVLLGVLAIVLLPRLLSTDAAREQLEEILSRVLGRPVTIEDLEVEASGPAVILRGVEVAQPAALAVPEEGPLLRAEVLRVEASLDDLLEERVVGIAGGQGVALTVLERGGTTSMHGLGRSAGTASPMRPAALPGRQLALDVELSSVQLRYVDLDRGESLDLSDVEMRGHLGDDASTREAIATLTAATVDVLGVELHDLLTQVRIEGSALQLVRLRAGVGARGVLEGHGWLGPDPDAAPGGEARDWSVSLELRDAALDGPLQDLLALAVPWVVQATGRPGRATTGQLGARVEAAGTGLHWTTIERTLHGAAELSLRDVAVPEDALLLDLAGLVGRERGPWTLEEAAIELSVAGGWIRPGPVQLGSLRPKVRGRISLRGELDLTVDVMPLVERYGGGIYATVAKATTSIPVRVTGTIDDPELAPPRPRDVARGLLGGALRRALSEDDED